MYHVYLEASRLVVCAADSVSGAVLLVSGGVREVGLKVVKRTKGEREPVIQLAPFANLKNFEHDKLSLLELSLIQQFNLIFTKSRTLIKVCTK